MTLQVAAVLVILVVAIGLFVSDRLRVDLVALLVLVSLAVSGLVTTAEALAGFSSPAVITVGAVFILSGGLARTGVADVVGRQVLRLAGQSESRLVAVIMLTAGVLSAFMNNVGVAALLLPVVLAIARKVAIAPSRLLIPLSFGCLLGGLTTLIGTSPNILANEMARDFGLGALGFFDFLPVGAAVMLAGIGYVVLVGRRLLPHRDPVDVLDASSTTASPVGATYGLEERLAIVEIPADSALAGRSLAESRLGQALGLTILGLQRHGRKQMAVHPDTVLHGGDRLLALGRVDRIMSLGRTPPLVVEIRGVGVDQLVSPEIGLAELALGPTSPFVGQTIAQLDLRRRYGFNVVAIRRSDRVLRTRLGEHRLQGGDMLLLQGAREVLGAAEEAPELGDGLRGLLDEAGAVAPYELHERLLVVRVPADSPLVGHSLAQSELGRLFGLEVLGLERHGESLSVPDRDLALMADDVLLVEGRPEALEIVRGLQGLIVRRHLQMNQVQLESDDIGLAEAVLSPHSSLAGKGLSDIHFREKYGLSVLAIWRNGRAYRSDLATMRLQFGDAFLLYGPRDKLRLLASEADFIVLGDVPYEETPRRERAALAAGIMVGVVVVALLGWLPIAIAALTGAAMMVLTGCLSMDEAYRYIEWRAVFLIACMLAMGAAMESSGAAHFLAEGVVAAVGGLGDTAILLGFFVMTMLAAQFMPSAVVMVLMAPIAVNMSRDLGLAPISLIILVSVAASTSFMSPVGHPVNVLMMGPGGYRFSDYTRVGAPLTLVVLLVTILVLPLVWPLRP